MGRAVFFIIIGGAAAELFLPWWSVVVVAFAVAAVFACSGWQAARMGFAGVGLLWLFAAAIIHFKSGGTLTARIAGMLQMPAPWLLLLVTAVLGALVGALAANAGFQTRALFKRRRG